MMGSGRVAGVAHVAGRCRSSSPNPIRNGPGIGRTISNGGGAAVPGTGSMPGKPKDAKAATDAKDAAPIKPKDADLSKTGAKSN